LGVQEGLGLTRGCCYRSRKGDTEKVGGGKNHPGEAGDWGVAEKTCDLDGGGGGAKPFRRTYVAVVSGKRVKKKKKKNLPETSRVR